MILTNENYFYNQLNTFGSNVLLTLKIMNFDNVAITKVVHIYVIKRMNHNICDIKSICTQNLFISNMQC
jgi:hypothetical protein